MIQPAGLPRSRGELGLERAIGRNAVFYDKRFEAELARMNLHTYLQRIYQDQSDLLVVFLCADYERKDWCRLEWSVIHKLVDSRQEDRLMLIRLDNGDVSGVVRTDGYLPGEGRSALEISDKILERLRLLDAPGQDHPSSDDDRR